MEGGSSLPEATEKIAQSRGRLVAIMRGSIMISLFALRLAGRILPLAVVWMLCWPVVISLSLKELIDERRRMPRVDALAASGHKPLGASLWRRALGRADARLTRLLFLWPEKYISPRFSRCRFEGTEHLALLDTGNRPVILATLHYGPMSMLMEFLRARRYPAAVVAFIGYNKRPWLRRHLGTIGDRLANMGHVPVIIEIGHVMAMREHLEQNRVLILAVEDGGDGGRHATIQAADDVGLAMISSVFKLAEITNAVVIPCLIRARPFFSFTIHFGRPVPEADIADRLRHPDCCRHLLEQFVPVLAQSPGQCTSLLLNAMRPAGGAASAREGRPSKNGPAQSPVIA